MSELNVVEIWWLCLSVIGLANLVLWSVMAWAFKRDRHKVSERFFQLRGWHVVLSAGYALGCAFRSLLPRADVQRICLVDSVWSSVALGRSVATVAELCFVAQWAIILNEIGKAARRGWVVRLSHLIVPTIAIAELCSWYAVLTTNYLGNTLEQSIWTFVAATVAVALWRVRDHFDSNVRALISAAIGMAMLYIVFMVAVDIRMYLTRYLADTAAGREYLTFAQGWHDAATRWVKTRSWEDWREEIAWMTLYFGPTVWLSIFLIKAPRFSHRVRLAP